MKEDTGRRTCVENLCVVQWGEAPGFETGVTTRKGEGDNSDGINELLYDWFYRGEKRCVVDIILLELFWVLWLLLLIGFLWCSTLGSIYFRVREWIFHTVVEPSMISITLVPTYLFNIEVFYDSLQCSCEEGEGKTCLKLDIISDAQLLMPVAWFSRDYRMSI